MNAKMLKFVLLISLPLIFISSCQNKQAKLDLLEYQLAEANVLDNLVIIRKSFELLDDLNIEAYNNLLASDHKIYMGSSDDPSSFIDIIPYIHNVYKAFPDYKHTIENIFTDNDFVVAQIRLSGTHTNPYKEIDPTNNMINYKGVFIFKILEEKISEIWVLEDNLTRDDQLGFALK